jgi:hypothetical protein
MFHFCPECGSTVYWDIAAAPELLGVAERDYAAGPLKAPGASVRGYPRTTQRKPMCDVDVSTVSDCRAAGR